MQYILARRRQLLEMLTAENNYLQMAPEAVAKRIRTHIRWLEKEREVCSGRAPVMAALYMGALLVARYNPTIKEFYERLLKADKSKKVALVVYMRKLLTILNALMRDHAVWRSPHALTP